jgi:hypothetical protein
MSEIIVDGMYVSSVFKRVEELKAENKRLTDELLKFGEFYDREDKKAEAENKRLKAGLIYITKRTTSKHICDIAERALEGRVLVQSREEILEELSKKAARGLGHG